MFRTCDLILKKRNGSALSKDELKYFVEGYVQGKIPDYQVSALAMAVYFKGMTEEEALYLTEAMISSGDRISLKAIPGVKVDKHSTGGVGDTTTLVLAPLVAAAGIPVVKLSGRGLGHTGGTLDKLESIPGFQTELSVDEIIAAVKHAGVVVAGQTKDLVPADKKLYALRDVTATVDSIPLIAASIMSKKLAAGADSLVLDVKCGSGAFFNEYEQAYNLACLMAAIGNGAGRETVALITSMEQPLGRAVGNALEVEEAILTLRGKGPADLEELCLVLGGWMLCLARKTPDPESGKAFLEGLLADGAALQKFKELIENQQGDSAVTEDISLLPRAEKKVPVKAVKCGYINRLEAELVGMAANALGAGRETKDSSIDPAVGITVEKKIGDRVECGETLAVIHARSEASSDQIHLVENKIRSAYGIEDKTCKKPRLVLGLVDRKGRGV